MQPFVGSCPYRRIENRKTRGVDMAGRCLVLEWRMFCWIHDTGKIIQKGTTSRGGVTPAAFHTLPSV